MEKQLTKLFPQVSTFVRHYNLTFLHFSQGCYVDECQWLALVQVDSGTYKSDTESLE